MTLTCQQTATKRRLRLPLPALIATWPPLSLMPCCASSNSNVATRYTVPTSYLDCTTRIKLCRACLQSKATAKLSRYLPQTTQNHLVHLPRKRVACRHQDRTAQHLFHCTTHRKLDGTCSTATRGTRCNGNVARGAGNTAPWCNIHSTTVFRGAAGALRLEVPLDPELSDVVAWKEPLEAMH